MIKTFNRYATRLAYETMKKYVIVLLGIIGCVSCNDSSQSRRYMPNQGYTEESADYADDSENSQQVQCPMCGGTGVFELMPGDVMAPKQTCTGCGGNGIVTAETAQQIIEAKRQVDAMMGGRGSSYGGGGGKSVSDLQYELKKAYETLEGMEYDRDMCTSMTLRPRYDRMIIEQKQRIAELERQLSEASY